MKIKLFKRFLLASVFALVLFNYGWGISLAADNDCCLKIETGVGVCTPFSSSFTEKNCSDNNGRRVSCTNEACKIRGYRIGTPEAPKTADNKCCLKGEECFSLSSELTAEYCDSETYGGIIIDCSDQACKKVTAPTTPTTPTATTQPTSTTATEFPNPLGFKTVQEVLSKVLSNLMGLILIVAVVFIVIGGLLYMLSGGNEEMITRAKKIWTGAIIGLAIALAAPTFLKEIQALLGGSTSPDAQTWMSSAPMLRQIAANVLNWLLSIIGIIAVIALIIGGGMYLTAYGDDDRIQKAKKIITYAIIGIVVALAALVIVKEVGKLLGARF